MLRDQSDAIGVAVGKAGAYGGGASAFFFGLTANEFAALSGVIVAVIGLAVQWFYNRRRDRRESAEFDARMSRYRQDGKASVSAVGATGGVLAVLLAAVAFIAPWEGQSVVPYRDMVGRLTWCYGETRGTPKAEYTQAECAAMLATGVGQFYDGVMKCVRRPLTHGQAVAVVSWAYNVGLNAACGSTLVRKLNAGAPASEWCAELLRWDYAGGKRVRGLTNRRQAEYAECVK